MKRISRIFSEAVFLIFIIVVFLYSTYRVLNYFKMIKFESWGASPCDWGKEWCDWLCRWPPCVTPTPTLPPEPTPTPTTPVPTEGPTPTPTPTSAPGPEAPGPAALGPGEPFVCGATTPEAPTLLSVTSIGLGEVELVWTEVTSATHYSIVYGPSSGNYLFGVANTGKVTIFRIGNLDPSVNYCFSVRAVNDCAPSELSNEICLGRVLGKVLGVTTLAYTGSFDRQSLELIIFTIGCLCLGVGLKLRFLALSF